MNVRSMLNFMLDMGMAYRVDRSGFREVELLINRTSCQTLVCGRCFSALCARIPAHTSSITEGNMMRL